MFKKMMLLASMSLAAMAFAVPAVASANWTHETSPLAGDTTIELSGPASFSIGGGAAGASATIHAELELTAGTTTAHVVSFEDTDCTGFGQLAGLTCTGTPVGLPWHAEIVPGGVVLNDIELVNHYYHPADVGHTTPLTTTTLVGDVFADPNNDLEISSVSLSGINTEANGSPAAVAGTLGVTPAGTYGIE